MPDGSLREFLVALGWESDKAQEQKFTDAIEKATLRAKLLSDGIEAAARKVYEAVGDMTERFDALYWAASRTGESAAFIKSFSYAISQLGGTVDGAKSSLDNMATAMRSNPGSAYFTRAFGIDRDPATGRMMPFNPAAVMAPGGAHGMLNAQGMPGPQFSLMQGGSQLDFATALAIARDPYAVQKLMNQNAASEQRFGLDPNKAADDANAVQTAWTKLMNDWQNFGDGLATKFAPITTTLLKLLDQTLLTPQKTYLPGEDPNDPDNAKAAAERQKQFEALYDPIRWGNAFHQTITDLNDEFTKLKDWIVWLVRDSAVARFFNFVTSNDEAGINGANAGRADGATLGDLLSKNGLSPTGSPSPTAAGGTLAQHQKELYDSLISQGVSDTAARRMVASVSRESLTNPADVHWDGSHYAHGIASWDDARSQRIEKQFGKSPDQMTIAEQAAAYKWELQTHFPEVWQSINEDNDKAAMYSLTKSFENPADPIGGTEKALGFLGGLPKDFGAASTATNSMVIGDSLAEGIHGYAGVSGGGIVGANSSAVLKEIGGVPGDISGKVVVLSTGLSNDFPTGATGEQIQDKLGNVKSQVDALLSRGVKPENIRILGFDPKAFPGVNEALKTFVSSDPRFAGVQIVPLQGDTDAAQHIHLSAQGYKDTAAAALASGGREAITDHWKEWKPDGLTSLDATSGNPANLTSTWLGSQFHSVDVSAPHNVSITVNGDGSSPPSAIGAPMADTDAFSALRSNQVAVGAQ